ncbi:glycosyltransferase family 1 protein [Streptomyces sp. R302]|uniref:glycosyltransferase n=1 Tax=unclassified Streptomyces TaxID=2593676 RepID=UPI00145DAAFF|nr:MULTISPECIES: glycosyltransferase [unclassified Streptomyces]NML51047.1 glycosyltransferase family 1 protein [Streptomyces sp. R301]NML81142.1 glycosyltransferase family 1 protein [Streptomyces sp. R302]
MRALFCPLSDPGYLYPATAVALEAHRRGHTVTLLSTGPAARAAERAGLDVLEPGEAFAVSRWFRSGEGQYHRILQAARTARPDVLVTSVLCVGALAAAETLDLPVVVLGLACHLWPHREGPGPDDAEDRGWRLDGALDVYRTLRAGLGLPGTGPDGRRALLGTRFLLRGHPGLEPPGAELPEGVRHVGPCWWEPPADEAAVAGIRARLDRTGKPVVYVHLGRVFGGESLWPWIRRTFTGGEFQALVETGRSETGRHGDPALTPYDPAGADDSTATGTADITVVRRPWMGPFLDRAGLVVTNGTSAPVLGTLRHRRPLLVSPNGGEQRVLAAACLRAGVAAPLDRARGDDQLRAAAADHTLSARATRMADELDQSKSESSATQAVEDACH